MKFPYIPIAYVIADVKAELSRMNLAGDIKDEDCINYAIECIREIGGSNYPEGEPAVVYIKDHIGKLPDSLYLIEEVWLCTAQIGNHPSGLKGAMTFSDEDIVYNGQTLLYPGDSFTGSKFCRKYQRNPNMTAPTYVVKHPKQIRCSIPNCVLGINHLALPQSQGDGYLMQDEINTIKATKAFITMKSIYEKWIMTEVPDYIFQNIKRDYETHLDQAQAIMKFDDPADDRARGKELDHRYDRFNLR
jgi:hypothetical protein